VVAKFNVRTDEKANKKGYVWIIISELAKKRFSEVSS